MNLNLYLPKLPEGQFWEITDKAIKILEWEPWSSWSDADWYLTHPGYEVEERTVHGSWWDRLTTFTFRGPMTYRQFRHRARTRLESFSLEELGIEEITHENAQDALELASRKRAQRIKDAETYGVYDPNASTPVED